MADTPAGFRSFRDAVRQHRRATPDKTALQWLPDGRSSGDLLSYTDLDERARRLSASLLDRVEVGSRALLMCEESLDSVVWFFGCLYAGVTVVPCPVPQRGRAGKAAERLAAVAADCAPGIVLANDTYDGDGVPSGVVPGGILRLGEALTTAAPDPEPDLAGGSIAYIQYTSGSTGTPKGVVVSNENLLVACEASANQVDPDSVSVSWLPITHDMGLVGGVMAPVLRGMEAVLMPSMAFLAAPVNWLRAITEYRGGFSQAPNFAYEFCLRRIPEEAREGLDLSSWRWATNAAEAVRADTLRRFAAAFAPYGLRSEALSPAYGLAEATLAVTIPLRDEPWRALTVDRDALETGVVELAGEATERRAEVVGCGRPIPGHELRVVDPGSLEPVAAGRVGEIWFAGPAVAQGYWNRPEETREVFGARLADGTGPWLRTGDLGFEDDGHVYIGGRLKEMVIIRGRNHYPADIERTVEAADPLVRSGCVAAFAIDGDAGEELGVALEVRDAEPADWDGVISRVRESVALEHGVSAAAVVLVSPRGLARTTSGKIRRRATGDAHRDGRLPVVAEWSVVPT